MPRPKKTTVCPIGGTGVGGKWKTWIWFHLLDGTKRFGELQRLIPGASRQMLTLQLRELEQLGVLRRREYEQQPPKVEYSLTELGRRSGPMLRRFVAWGGWFCDQAGLDFDDWLVSLGTRWKIWIWFHLLSGTKRFGDLQRLLPQASRQVLSMELRELERMGVLHRQASVQGHLKVEYSLTDLGWQAGPEFRLMHAWGRWFCAQAGLEYDWSLRDEAIARIHPIVCEPGWLASRSDEQAAPPIGA